MLVLLSTTNQHYLTRTPMAMKMDQARGWACKLRSWLVWGGWKGRYRRGRECLWIRIRSSTTNTSPVSHPQRPFQSQAVLTEQTCLALVRHLYIPRVHLQLDTNNASGKISSAVEEPAEAVDLTPDQCFHHSEK